MTTLTIKTNSDKADTTENSSPVTRASVKDKLGRSYGTGRRKNSVARVWVKAGSGKIIVNHKNLAEYFMRDTHRMVLLQPLDVIKTTNNFDIMCTVKGGGLSGQAGAIRHGISRALDQYDPNFHSELKSHGFLARDPRVVERKKYGQPKARRKKQFSKR